MPPPTTPPTWDILYTAKPTCRTPTWRPTHHPLTPLQTLKFLSAAKYKADAILAAVRALGSPITWHVLTSETDNIGREAKALFGNECKTFRLQAVKRGDGTWEATVWPGAEELGWEEGKVARGTSLEACLGEMQELIRGQWGAGKGG